MIKNLFAGEYIVGNILSELASGLNKALEDKDIDIVSKIAEGVKGLKEDVDSIMERDPAASSEAEVMF